MLLSHQAWQFPLSRIVPATQSPCYVWPLTTLPQQMRWLFWDVEFDSLSLEAAKPLILARVLERGRLVDVQWIIGAIGLDEIHRFLRDVGHAELSVKTLAFWRTVLNAEGEEWQSPPNWRQSSSAPWIS